MHIGRGLYYGSYRSPRVLLWSIGVIILVLMMAQLGPNCDFELLCSDSLCVEMSSLPSAPVAPSSKNLGRISEFESNSKKNLNRLRFSRAVFILKLPPAENDDRSSFSTSTKWTNAGGPLQIFLVFVLIFEVFHSKLKKVYHLLIGIKFMVWLLIKNIFLKKV